MPENAITAAYREVNSWARIELPLTANIKMLVFNVSLDSFHDLNSIIIEPDDSEIKI